MSNRQYNNYHTSSNKSCLKVKNYGQTLDLLKQLENSQGQQAQQIFQQLIQANSSLHNLQNIMSHIHDFYGSFLRGVARMAIYALNYTQNYKVLSSQSRGGLELTRKQCAGLVSLMFLNCLSQTTSYTSNTVNFNKLMSLSNTRNQSNQEKLKCIINYLQYMGSKGNDGEKIYISRYSNSQHFLPQQNNRLSFMKIDNFQMIQDYSQGAIVDFANSYIGGGVLNNGSVQEEIMFATMPEMLVSLLFVEKIQDDESIIFGNIQRYSSHTGYSDSFRFTGPCYQKGKYEIIAIDAIDFSKLGYLRQYDSQYIRREINKAYVGFKNCRSSEIVTGNWGCGAFKGDSQLKFLIQWVAASLTGKKITYCTFNDKNLMQVQKVIDKICRKSPQEVMKMIENTQGKIFDAILQKNDFQYKQNPYNQKSYIKNDDYGRQNNFQRNKNQFYSDNRFHSQIRKY